jgi:hypothetical protein
MKATNQKYYKNKQKDKTITIYFIKSCQKDTNQKRPN